MGTEIHWLAVIVAGVAAFMVGGLWYSVLFGKMWMEARGLTVEDAKKNGGNVGMMFGITFLLDVVIAFVLDHTLGTYGNPDMSLTLMIAGGIAAGFIIPAMAVNYLYQQATLKHFLIDAGHWMAALLAMGLVLELLG
jgi:hypothetical protein